MYIGMLLIGIVIGAILGGIAVIYHFLPKLEKEGIRAERNRTLFMLMNEWFCLQQEGHSVAEYLRKEGYHKVAIYGMADVGQTLYRDLKSEDIEVAYAIDKRASYVKSELTVYSLTDELPQVNAVIVTPVYFYNQIVKDIGHKVNCEIISLEDILNDV